MTARRTAGRPAAAPVHRYGHGPDGLPENNAGGAKSTVIMEPGLPGLIAGACSFRRVRQPRERRPDVVGQPGPGPRPDRRTGPGVAGEQGQAAAAAGKRDGQSLVLAVQQPRRPARTAPPGLAGVPAPAGARPAAHPASTTAATVSSERAVTSLFTQSTRCLHQQTTRPEDAKARAEVSAGMSCAALALAGAKRVTRRSRAGSAALARTTRAAGHPPTPRPSHVRRPAHSSRTDHGPRRSSPHDHGGCPGLGVCVLNPKSLTRPVPRRAG